MKDYVQIREVGLREGVQSLPEVLSTAEKIELVGLLNCTGVREIEIAALVRADRVPSMIDADGFIAAFPREDGVKYSALYLNRKGFERGEQSNRLDNRAWLYAAATKTFFEKNYNRDLERFLVDLPVWKEAFTQANKPLHGFMLSCAFGCAYEGEVATAVALDTICQVMNALEEQGMLPIEICLADTVGYGTPQRIKALVSACKSEFPEANMSLHLHDTRGLGISNALAGIEAGVRTFESSLGGLGGCPFAPGASGNVATEELVYLCESEGLTTGISLEAYCKVLLRLEELVGAAAIPSKLYRALKGSTFISTSN